MPNSHQNKPVVYVLQDNGTKNIYPATILGMITVFTRNDMSAFIDTKEWVSDLATWLSSYDPDKDYILLIGDPLLISAASAVTALMFSSYTVLKWDRQERVYIPVKFTPGEGVAI